MNRGIILTFISSIISSFPAWFDNSILGKAGRFVNKIWQAVIKNSFIVNWFMGASPKQKYRDQSAVFRAVKTVCKAVKKLFGFFAEAMDKSAVISGARWYFYGFFDISTAHYGIFAVSASLVYFLLRIISGGFAAFYTGVCIGIIVFSALIIAVNLSVRCIFKGSILKKIFFGFIQIDDTSEKDVIPVSALSGAVFGLFGIADGFLCFKLGVVYGTAALAGFLFVCAVLYDFRLGTYTALVIFPYSPTMAIVGIILLTLLSLLIKALTDNDFRFVRTPLDFPLAALLAVMLISTLTSYARASSVKVYLVYFVFICSFYCITNTVTDFKCAVTAAVLMLIAALGVSGYGIHQHIFGFAEGKTWTDTDMFEDIATRVVSTFDNPNVLGEYLLLLIPLGVGLFLSVKGGFSKLGHLALTAAMSICMIYTYSRGNWIGLIAAIFMFIMFYDTRFVWLGVIAVFMAPLVLAPSVISRFTSIGDTADTSTSYRVYIWMGTIAMLRDYWLCGIGLGSDAFNMIYPHYSYAGIVAPHSHNLYLQLITENGISGLIVFLILIFAYYRMVITKITKLKRAVPKAVITALAAGVFGYLVQGMFDNVWYNYRVFFMFFAVLALTAAAVNTSKGVKAND